MGPGRVEVHHHEVASCQLEIGVSFNTMVRKAITVPTLKSLAKVLRSNHGENSSFNSALIYKK